MPCTLGGAPVTIDRLLGLVNVGTTASTTSDVPVATISPSHGAAPASTARVTYSGSHPSTHTTTTGPFGPRYSRPFTVTDPVIPTHPLTCSIFPCRTIPHGRSKRSRC